MSSMVMVINSRDSTPLSDSYPNAYFWTKTPTLQNVDSISLDFVRLDARISNINEWNNWFWLRYPDASSPDNEWIQITMPSSLYETGAAISQTINGLILASKPAGSNGIYVTSYDDSINRFAFRYSNSSSGEGMLKFENSSLRFLLGYENEEYDFKSVGGSTHYNYSENSLDLFAPFKEVYLLCGTGQNVNYDIIWPKETSPRNLIAILPLSWQANDRQDSQFLFTAFALQYFSPDVFSTPSSINQIDFQLLFRDTMGFHILPQEESLAGNTISVRYHFK